MLKQTTRKFAIIATVVFACVAVAACGSTGSAGNDARMTKDVNAKKSVVTTAEEKTEATTTTSSTETTTSKSETSTTTTTTTETTTSEPENTTTTTTAAITAEPEKTEEVTTTIEATTTTAEPEITETEATTAEVPEETGIVTMADNPDGMYPMEECFRRVIEEYTKSKVVNINIVEVGISEAVTEDGRKFMLGVGEITVYYNGDLTNINDYIIADSLMEGYENTILYAPSK